MNFYENLEDAMKNLTTRGAFLTVKNNQGVNVAMVRPQRYTYEFLKTAKDYTISIPYSDGMKKALTICGTKSGKDIDKAKEANIKFLNSKTVSSPIVDNCNMYYECKITYVDRIKKDKFPDELKKNYPIDDYHFLYYGEIVDCYN